ncbi:MAG TPA: hypothetical protein VNS02_08430 [Rhizobiaceae bacterium]|nr:hypothetical protein [Rhizobiaceae bacterium]
MTGTDDRMARAGAYVLGLMDDDARERAERDMLTDPAFLAYVARFASRMGPPAGTAPETWQTVAQHIASLPQMKGMRDGAAPEPRAIAQPELPEAVLRKLRAADTSQPAPGGTTHRSILAASVLVALCVGYAGGLLTAPAAGVCAAPMQAAAVTPTAR